MPSPAEQKDLLGRAKDEITAHAAALDEALAALSRRAYAQPPAQQAPGAAIPWLGATVPRGVADSGLIRGSIESVDAWIAVLGDGSRFISPVGDLAAAMDQWRAHDSHALDRIHEATRLEEDRQHAQTALSQAKPDSPEWTQAHDTEAQRGKDVAEALKAARSDLESTLSIPKPFSATDRRGSPFTGSFNTGPASQIALYADRSSALIGEPVNVQIGLGNEDGPNCAAAKRYSVELKCTGCEVAPTVTIEEGERFKPAPVRITAKTSTLHASSPGLKDRDLNLSGCVFDPKIHVTSQVSTAAAPADGRTPVAALVIFRNDAGDPATDGHQRILDFAPHGTDVKFNPAPENGHIVRDGHESLDIDECASRQELVADHAGAATLEIKYLNAPLNPPAGFHFSYIWRAEDLEWWLAAALISWLATCAKPVFRTWAAEDVVIRTVASFVGAMAGAGIALEAVYLALSHFDSIANSRIPCAISGLVGGALGLVTLRWVERYRAVRKAAADAE